MKKNKSRKYFKYSDVERIENSDRKTNEKYVIVKGQYTMVDGMRDRIENGVEELAKLLYDLELCAGTVGKAKCMPGDAYDFTTGKKIASCKAELNAMSKRNKNIQKACALLEEMHDKLCDMSTAIVMHANDLIDMLNTHQPEENKYLKFDIDDTSEEKATPNDGHIPQAELEAFFEGK